MIDCHRLVHFAHDRNFEHVVRETFVGARNEIRVPITTKVEHLIALASSHHACCGSSANYPLSMQRVGDDRRRLGMLCSVKMWW